MEYNSIYKKLEDSIIDINKKNIEKILLSIFVNNIKSSTIKNLFNADQKLNDNIICENVHSIATQKHSHDLYLIKNDFFYIVLTDRKESTSFNFQYVYKNMELALYENSFSIRTYKNDIKHVSGELGANNVKESSLISTFSNNATVFNYNEDLEDNIYNQSFLLKSDDVFRMLFSNQNPEDIKDIYRLKHDIDLDKRFNFSESHNLVRNFINSLNYTPKKTLKNNM